MKGIELQGGIESGDGFRVLVKRHVILAEKIVRIGVVSIEGNDALKIAGGKIRMAEGIFEQAEVVPDARIFRFARGGFVEDGLGLGKLLQVQEGDRLIEARGVETRIEGVGLLKFREGRFLLLAIHVGDAEIVVEGGFGFGGRGGRLCGSARAGPEKKRQR